MKCAFAVRDLLLPFLGLIRRFNSHLDHVNLFLHVLLFMLSLANGVFH